MHPIMAQVAYLYSWPGFWLFLLIVAGGLGGLVYLLFRAMPPNGPRIGE